MAFIDDEYAWPPDPEVFTRNQNALTLEYLAPYYGRHVAWSRDDTEVLADGADMGEVEEQLIRRGIEPRKVVFGYVDDPEVDCYIASLYAIPLSEDECGESGDPAEGSSEPSAAGD